MAEAGGISREAAARLVRRYGSRALPMARDFGAADRQPLAGAPGYLCGEIRHMLRHERVTRLHDIVLRRSLMAYEGSASVTSVTAVAEVMSRETGWSRTQLQAETEDLLVQLRDRHRVVLAGGQNETALHEEATVA
ncbi:glycerol-3-phosphate dehydrogenase C-terminal domain-containing protein [Mangrovicoccus ximenensis]|uniref:glycerol-3-phosphate dehydrogenase C-terminal domain-containing protein n=1 Tax=Mangrovicoccus ximenensis TaxID=1911570 RepID=UPI001F1F136D|nr:glycerol-3-phosphate dehydrogenase C-terminal domain-containing protein [Mangrovicoccus ximenensis]